MHSQGYLLKSPIPKPDQLHIGYPLLERPLLQPPKDMPNCLLTIEKKRRNAVFTTNDEEAMKLSSELKDQLWAVFMTTVGLT